MKITSNPHMSLPEDLRELATIVAQNSDPLHSFISVRHVIRLFFDLTGKVFTNSIEDKFCEAVAWSAAARRVTVSRNPDNSYPIAIMVDDRHYDVSIPGSVWRRPAAHYDPYQRAGRYTIRVREASPREMSHITRIVERAINRRLAVGGFPRVHVSWRLGEAMPWECEIESDGLLRNKRFSGHLTKFYLPWGWLQSLRGTPPPHPGWVPLFQTWDAYGKNRQLIVLLKDEAGWHVWMQNY